MQSTKYHHYFISLFFLANVFFQPLYAQSLLTFSSTDTKDLDLKVCEAVLESALNQMDIQVDFIYFPYTRGLRMSNSGKTDGEVLRVSAIENIYSNLKRIPVPCNKFPSFLFVKKEHKFEVNGWESIPSTFILGYQRGIIYIENAVLKNQISSHRVNSADQLVKLLELNRIQAFIVNQNVVNKLINLEGSKNIIKLEPPVQYVNTYSYLHSKHEALIPELTSIFEKMRDSGRIQEIKESVYNAASNIP